MCFNDSHQKRLLSLGPRFFSLNIVPVQQFTIIIVFGWRHFFVVQQICVTLLNSQERIIYG